MTSSNSHLFHVALNFNILSKATDICFYKDQEPFRSILNIYDYLLKVAEFHMITDLKSNWKVIESNWQLLPFLTK